MSSRLTPPNVGACLYCLDEDLDIASVDFVKDVNVGKHLKEYTLPSITGLPAAAPISPSPKLQYRY